MHSVRAFRFFLWNFLALAECASGRVEEARLLGAGMTVRYPENQSVQELVRSL